MATRGVRKESLEVIYELRRHALQLRKKGMTYQAVADLSLFPLRRKRGLKRHRKILAGVA